MRNLKRKLKYQFLLLPCQKELDISKIINCDDISYTHKNKKKVLK